MMTSLGGYIVRIFCGLCYVAVLANFVSYVNYRRHDSTHFHMAAQHRAPRQVRHLNTMDLNSTAEVKPLSGPVVDREHWKRIVNSRAKVPVKVTGISAEKLQQIKGSDLDDDVTGSYLSDEEYEKLPPCPEVSPLHKGLTPENLQKVSGVDYLKKILPFLKDGSHRPQDCKVKEKLAIIIPHRDRWPHLLIMIKNLAPLLMRQQADFRIYVIDQVEGHIFNKAMLLNVGYLEANKDNPYDCYVFQDVDMIPRNDRCLYRCAEVPMHLCNNVSKWAHMGGMPYEKYFGGAMAYSDKQWNDMNGASTLYFGWGLEDDDVRERSRNAGYFDRHFPREHCYYDNLLHERDHGNTVNVARDIHRKSWHSRQPYEGLNTMRYKVVSRTVTKLFTWVSVDIDQHDVLMHAPAYLLKDLSKMYEMEDILKNRSAELTQ